MIKCARCSMEKEPHKHNKHLCEDCVKLENNRVSVLRQQNVNWPDIAAEAGLELWERQPAETDFEWSVWLRYRDAYPGARPSYRQVAEELNTSVGNVKKVGQRWTFPARLQAWARHIDETIMVQREKEILEMNKQHVDMAMRLNQKISKAIDQLDPYAVSPRELSSLIKTATELERKGRLDQEIPGKSLVLGDENPELKEGDIKTSDIGEILKVLGGAGVLGDIGVRKTVTTEVVVRGEEDH